MYTFIFGGIMSIIASALEFLTSVAAKRNILKNTKDLIIQRNVSFNAKIEIIQSKIETIKKDLYFRTSDSYLTSMPLNMLVTNNEYVEYQRNKLLELLDEKQLLIDEELKYQKQILNNIYKDT